MVFLFECSEVLLPSGFHNLSAGLEQRKKKRNTCLNVLKHATPF